MKATGIVSQVISWILIAAAIGLGIQPGSAARTRFEQWRALRVASVHLLTQWHNLAEGARRIGSTASAPNVVEFLDYGCGHCRRVQPAVDAILAADSGASIGVRYLLTQPGPQYRTAALAGICADAQGHFQSMHNYLLTATGWIDENDWTRIAEHVGVPDAVELRECINSGTAAAVLKSDSTWAASMKLRGTPTFVTSEGEVLLGRVPSADVVARPLERAGS